MGRSLLTYKALYRQDEGGVHAELVDFPGVCSCGDDLEHARHMIRSALVDMENGWTGRNYGAARLAVWPGGRAVGGATGAVGKVLAAKPALHCVGDVNCQTLAVGQRYRSRPVRYFSLRSSSYYPGLPPPPALFPTPW